MRVRLLGAIARSFRPGHGRERDWEGIVYASLWGYEDYSIIIGIIGYYYSFSDIFM